MSTGEEPAKPQRRAVVVGEGYAASTTSRFLRLHAFEILIFVILFVLLAISLAAAPLLAPSPQERARILASEVAELARTGH
jgi:hypothetical protein